MRLLRALVTTAVVAAASFSGVALVGAHGGDATLVHGCVATDGTLRLLGEPGASCDVSETALDWRQGGLPGPAGPQGAAGDAGPSGASGRGLVFRRVQRTESFPTKREAMTLDCDPGEQAVGGGYESDGVLKTVVRENQPTLGFRGWRVELDSYVVKTGRKLTGYAICARTADRPAYVPARDSSGRIERLCASACVPASLKASVLVTSGVPITANIPSGRPTVRVSALCLACLRPKSVPRRARAAATSRVSLGRETIRRAARGRIALGLRPPRRLLKALRRARRGTVVVTVRISPRTGPARRMVRRIRLRRG
jgi:hypothetical protein